MFKFSIKQLLRQKGRAILFFLLLAASTALVLTGAVMTIESAQRIAKVESTYSTIGMVQQLPVDTQVRQSKDSCEGEQLFTQDIYGDPVMMDALDFPGADYIVKPQQRPYFMTYQPDMDFAWGMTMSRHIVEFTPLGSTDGTEPVDIKITRVLYSEINGSNSSLGDGTVEKILKEGDVISFSQDLPDKLPLEAGERYVSNIQLQGVCKTHGEVEYRPYLCPSTSQSDSQGRLMDRSGFFAGADDDNPLMRVQRVTGDDFYQPGHFGSVYEKWAELHGMENHIFPVLGASSLEVLPSFHDLSAKIQKGRAITPEEFAEGAPVCLLSERTAQANKLSVGDRISLPLMCAFYGGSYIYYYDAPLLNADGQFYDVFWEQEYEIVGLYSGGPVGYTDMNQDIWTDMFIIPISSVGAGWEDNIAEWNVPSKEQATFQIPNGSIQSFDAALKENVPEAANLRITYDDRGYTQVMKSLRNSRDMAYLLLLGGVLAALAIIALLMYFFVVKEKKRTAIERSLGMSKRKCRVSLLGGLAVLTAASVIAGTVLGTAALGIVGQEPAPTSAAAEEPAPEELDAQYKFSTKFSLWAAGRELAEETVIEAEAPVGAYLLPPIALCLIIAALSWLLLERSFGTDPIYLLSTRETK